MRIEASRHAIHHQRAKTLGLRDRAVLVSQQKGFQVDNFLSELSDGSGQSIVFRGKELNLGLEVGQPLLLALTALQGRDTKMDVRTKDISAL